MSNLRCGAAVRDVTPPLGLNIPQCMSLNPATGIKDRLYTHAIALECDKKKALIISIDTSGLGASFARRVRREISERAGLSPDAIMVSAIHIHTGGPQLMEVFWGQKEDKDVTDFFLTQTVEASLEALGSMKEVTARFSTCFEDRFSFCRNYLMKDGSIVMNPDRRSAENIVRPVAEIDYSLSSLRFVDTCGDPVAEIVNFACHPDTVGGREYSADYPGELRRAIKEVYGEKYTVLFLNGFSGNVNHIDAKRFADPDFRYPRDHYKIMGRALAERLLTNRENEEVLPSDLSYAQKRFLAPRRQPTDAEVENAERSLADASASGISKSLAKEILKLKKHPRKNELVEIQVIKIADVYVVGFPGEPFSDIGLEIRKKNPDVRLIFSELANNELGYFATEPAFSAHVYEAVLPSDPFEIDVINRMIDTSGMLIDKIK